MKRLTCYLVVSLLCNITILAIIMLPANKGKAGNGALLIPVNLLSNSGDQKYRPSEAAEKNIVESRKSNREENPAEDKRPEAKYRVEIPEPEKKQRKFMKLEEYRSYKNNIPLEGAVVAEMRISFPEDLTESMLKEIITFFGFKLIAHPRCDPDYLIVCTAPEFNFKKLHTGRELEEFYSDNSNRTIELEKGPESRAKSLLENNGVDTGNLSISLLMGGSSGYFHWKELLASKYVSRLVNDISYIESCLSKTPEGYWILLVKGVRLKDGQYLEVVDQELNEIIL